MVYISKATAIGMLVFYLYEKSYLPSATKLFDIVVATICSHSHLHIPTLAIIKKRVVTASPNGSD